VVSEIDGADQTASVTVVPAAVEADEE